MNQNAAEPQVHAERGRAEDLRRCNVQQRSRTVQIVTSRKRLVLDWLVRRGISFVTAADWHALAAETGLPEAQLRRVLREAGVGAAQPFAGIRQRTLEELEISLLEMLLAYREAPDRDSRRYCRRVVIQAKDHAKLAAYRAKDPALKREMAMWMLVWLENPEVFPAWVELRKRVLEAASPGQ